MTPYQQILAEAYEREEANPESATLRFVAYVLCTELRGCTTKDLVEMALAGQMPNVPDRKAAEEYSEEWYELEDLFAEFWGS